jgi:hypothetical protein
MGFFAWLRRVLEPPSARHDVTDHEWGEVREWVEGDCRNVQWSATVESWDELGPVVDRFLAAAVDDLVTAHLGGPAPWMVLRFNPLTGMLSVSPAPEPSWEGGDERVELSLSSWFWETEARRTYNASRDGSFEPLYERVWGQVRMSLRGGEAGRCLTAHPLRIAGFNSPTGCDEEPVADLTGPSGSPEC